MKTQKIIYLKNTENPDAFWRSPRYWKVIEETENTQTMEVSKDTISIEENDEFFDQVSFIKNKICEGFSEEITREEFDEFYKKTVEKINNLSKL